MVVFKGMMHPRITISWANTCTVIGSVPLIVLGLLWTLANRMCLSVILSKWYDSLITPV